MIKLINIFKMTKHSITGVQEFLKRQENEFLIKDVIDEKLYLLYCWKLCVLIHYFAEDNKMLFRYYCGGSKELLNYLLHPQIE